MFPTPPRPVEKGWSAWRPRASATSRSCRWASFSSAMMSARLREGERMFPAPPRPEWVTWRGRVSTRATRQRGERVGETKRISDRFELTPVWVWRCGCVWMCVAPAHPVARGVARGKLPPALDTSGDLRVDTPRRRANEVARASSAGRDLQEVSQGPEICRPRDTSGHVCERGDIPLDRCERGGVWILIFEARGKSCPSRTMGFLPRASSRLDMDEPAIRVRWVWRRRRKRRNGDTEWERLVGATRLVVLGVWMRCGDTQRPKR
jgi:hypothetical protein